MTITDKIQAEIFEESAKKRIELKLKRLRAKRDKMELQIANLAELIPKFKGNRQSKKIQLRNLKSDLRGIKTEIGAIECA